MRRGDELKSVYLRPAEIALVQEPAEISTVLGSCVSFTLFHRRQKVGGMCHALLPSGKDGEAFRYVDSSLRYLLDEFRRRGVRKREIEVKLFGGADMFDACGENRPRTVGRQNITAALELIRKEGLILSASDVGGVQGRKIHFYTDTGEVLLRRLKKQELQSEPC